MTWTWSPEQRHDTRPFNMLESSPLFKVSGTNQSAVRLANCSGPMMDPRQQAIGQLLAAMANASNALGKRLASKTHTFVGSHAQRCLPAICEAARDADRRVKKTLMIKGAIALRTIHSVHAVKLEAHFWPDKNDRSPQNLFEDLFIVASDILFLIIFGCLAAVYVRMDISVPRDLPLRFNRARQRLYAYNFRDSWWNPFRSWRAAPVAYDWSQVRAERWHKRAFTPQGVPIFQWGVELSIVEPGTNKVIDRFPLSAMGADEFAWAYICTYMQQGPSALPPPDPPRDHTDVPWYKIGLRFAPEVKWPADMDLESRTAP